ncbi:ABC transporter substrate-binding protein [Grimontia sedimenti]|uniref:ABC transporter substrate-binding protein n=1 Tax=Grimontia sedimenti TaxID=2711294 RepID=UPI0022A66CA3|nr:ABC transporter substrate-binding protein [Grimontia sedimenti]
MRQAHKPLLEQNREHFGTALVEQFLQAREDWTNPHPTDLLVALDADLSGGSAISGLSIRRGIELALEEINANGGILGKQVKLVARDNSMVPSRGLDNIEVFSKLPNLLAVFSGISSPVVLAELDMLHERKILMLAPWQPRRPLSVTRETPILSSGSLSGMNTPHNSCWKAHSTCPTRLDFFWSTMVGDAVILKD